MPDSSLFRPLFVITIRVYLVVIDIHIVDCHMYPGEPCPSSHVLSYIPAEASMQYNHPSITPILFPSTLTAAASRAKALGWDGSSRLLHGRSAQVFFCQCHLACKAHAITSRLGIPSPPRSRGLMTFSHETKQQPPLACSPSLSKENLF